MALHSLTTAVPPPWKSASPRTPYRFVRRWLERRPRLTLRQIDPIIRQLTLYRDFIDSKTQENHPE